MSNNNDNAVQLYAPHTDMVMARLRSPRVKDTPEPEAQARLAKMVDAVALIIDARHMSPQDADITAALVVAELRKDQLAGDLTWEEVGKVLQDGAFGKYGPVYKVSAATIYNFICSYVDSEEKLELSRKVRALREGQQRKNQERVAEFLANNSEYARILMEKARENTTR